MMTIPENNLSFAVAFNGFEKFFKLSRLWRMHLFWVRSCNTMYRYNLQTKEDSEL